MYLASTNCYTPPDAQNVVKSATYPWTNAQISSGLQLGPLCKPCDDGHALSLACYKCLMILLYACTYSFQNFLQRPLYFYQAKEMVKYLGFNFVKRNIFYTELSHFLSMAVITQLSIIVNTDYF